MITRLRDGSTIRFRMPFQAPPHAAARVAHGGTARRVPGAGVLAAALLHGSGSRPQRSTCVPARPTGRRQRPEKSAGALAAARRVQGAATAAAPASALRHAARAGALGSDHVERSGSSLPRWAHVEGKLRAFGAEPSRRRRRRRRRCGMRRLTRRRAAVSPARRGVTAHGLGRRRTGGQHARRGLRFGDTPRRASSAAPWSPRGRPHHRWR